MSGFEEVRFPDSISYNSGFGPSFSTAIIENDAGEEERSSRWEHPRRIYDAAYGVKTFDQLSEVLRFYIAMRGPAIGFRFKDWTDFTTALNGKDPYTALDVVIGVGNGVNNTFQLVKKYTVGSLVRTRNITKPVATKIAVAVDGVAKTLGVHYNLNTTNGTITFTGGNTPPNGHQITAGCEFDVPVRFGKLPNELLILTIDNFDSGDIGPIPMIELRETPQVNGEVNYGGAYEEASGANFFLSPLKGKVVVLQATTTGLKAFLPSTANLPSGGPYFHILNIGANSILIRDAGDTTTYATLASGQFTTILLSEDANNVKRWYAIGI